MASFGDHCDPKLLLVDRTGSGFDMETFKDREALFLALLEGTGLMREPALLARLKQLEAAADAIRAELGETSDAADRWPCGELKDGGPEDVMGCPIHGAACPDDDDNDESEDGDG